jgi:hypothetical protein
MSLTVKRAQRLVRAGKAGTYLDGPPNGMRGLYLVVESSATRTSACAIN